HAHETIFGFIGDGAAMLVRRALGDGVTDAEVERGLDYFLKYYRAHMLDNTVAYPGVREALAELAGDSAATAGRPARAMAVLTNKPVVFSRAILDGLGLARYFRFVYGGNSFERKKPDPMGVEVLLRDLQASPGEALMIGDSDVDIKTARNAGIFACGVSYGFGLEGLRAHPPDLMVDSLTELAGYLNGNAQNS
ncbi:MAG: HAD-IA family hydrolase, partial [Candidatus Acidiferrales bacterium]